jgi:hypothetical protein
VFDIPELVRYHHFTGKIDELTETSKVLGIDESELRGGLITPTL